jgi:PAS domain S-box-containing protein
MRVSNWSSRTDPIRVLLIEPDPRYARLVQGLLTETTDPAAPAFRVTHADCLSCAMFCLNSTATEVMLLALSNSQGLETLARLQAHAPEVPTILLCGPEDHGLVHEVAEERGVISLAKAQLGKQLLPLAIRYGLERRRFSGELRASETRFRTMIERNADGILVLTRAGIIRYLNPAAEALFGHEGAKLIGQPFGFPVRLGVRTELEVVRSDGRILNVEMRVAHTEWEGQPAYLASLRDSTERQQAAEALRQSEERYRLLAEHATDMISRHTPKGTYLYASPACRTLLGYHAAELVGRHLFDFCHPDDLVVIRAARREVLARPTVHVISYRMRRKDGTYAWFETTGKTVRDPETNEVLEFITVSRDISERKQAEQALEQQAEELRRSNAELEQFAYVASHDLQEPLRMVTSYLQLLVRRHRERLDTDAEEFIAFAVDGAKRMRELINDLLAYSRVGTRGKTFEPTDCEAVLAWSLANLRLAIEESGAVITHDPLPTVMADASQLAQLLQNLLSNAIKFRSAEPPRIHIAARREAASPVSHGQDTPDPEFEVLASLANAGEVGRPGAGEPCEETGTWVLSVRDNGIGIDPAFAQRVFVIFQRLHPRGDFPGTGIGLAVCKKIVERHGGRIWLESVPGQGTTFYFTLQAANPRET